MTWCHHYKITLRARLIPGCLNMMANLLSRSNHVQSTEWSLHLQVFKQICQRWFTHHVDLFATHLNHTLPPCMSAVPDPNAWDIDALNINWTGLTAYAYPPTALLHRVIQKSGKKLLPDHRNNPRLARDALVLGPSAALNRDPTSTSSVKSLLKQSHNYVFHNISTSKPGVWEWTAPRTRLLCGGGRENWCPSEVINKDHLQVKWALFEK